MNIIFIFFGVTVFVLLLDWTMSTKVYKDHCLVVYDPASCPDDDISVYLFTRRNADEGQLITFTETTDNMNSTYFNPVHPNKVVLHGYGANYKDLEIIKDGYLHHGEYNVWMADYAKLFENPKHGGFMSLLWCYVYRVFYNIRHVGHCLAQLIVALRRHTTAPVHVIGFSIGAHTANYVANKLAEIGHRSKLDRITGLDPAGFVFWGRFKRHRLDPTDADFVDVVHTEGLTHGNLQNLGHVDVYMNGGFRQPTCENVDVEYQVICNHCVATEYFAESIHTKVGFLGWQCRNYIEYLFGMCIIKHELVPMGEHCPHGTRGTYITYTAKEKPYALGNWAEDSFLERAPMSFTKQEKLMKQLTRYKLNTNEPK